MTTEERGDRVFVCGDPEPQKIYWSGTCDPDVWPKMKVAWWATIKWRVRRWWTEVNT